MAQQYNNPFQSIQIISPITQRDDYDRYCQRGQTRPKGDMSPFPRKVDLWFAGLALAARENLEQRDLTKEETVSIISGNVFNTDGWQAQAVMLIAIAVKDNLEVVLQQGEMMKIANGLAAAGVPHIVKMLNEGQQKPIWNLSEALEKLLQSDAGLKEESDHDRLTKALL